MNFNILLNKLDYYGIRGTALKWVKSYYSFLYPYFNAGITLWGKCNTTTLSTLATIQKRAIRLIYNKKNRTPSAPLFIKAKILPLNYIYLLSVLSFMFKVHHNKLPIVIQDIFTKRHTISAQTTRQTDFLNIPIYKSAIAKKSIFCHYNINVRIPGWDSQTKESRNICLLRNICWCMALLIPQTKP